MRFRTVQAPDKSGAMVFSRDGTQLFAGGSETMIRSWNVLTGLEEGLPLNRHTSRVYGLALTQDGLRLASSSPDQSVILWDVLAHCGHVAETWPRATGK